MQSTSTYQKLLSFLFLLGFIFVLPSSASSKAVALYTPYTQITVTPGQKIDYSIKLINNTSSIRDVGLTIYGLPKGWSYTLKSGSWQVSQLAVEPHKTKTLSLEVHVPLKVEKGTYRLHVRADGYDNLPLTIKVSESGSYESSFSIKQANLEGAANTSFDFSGTLKNATADTAFYAFRAQAPRGWHVDFKANYKQVASVKINPNGSENISIKVKPPEEAKAGNYKIPIVASSSHSTAKTEISVTITGSYKMNLSTPTGRLSTDITAGSTKEVTLAIKNTGSSTLKEVTLSATSPEDWHVDFKPKKLTVVQPGETAKVTAKIKASSKSIAGDYVTAIKAKTDNASSQAKFRVSVKTSPIWGWLGILIIVVALGCVYFLFKKYGRR